MTQFSRRIADAITDAILAHALPPGAKLGERELAEAAGASRAVVKQALVKLTEHGLVDTRPNRGASVARLTIHDAYDLFEALTILEQGVAMQLAERMGPSEWDVLERHVDAVQWRIERGEDAGADVMGPEFHSILVGLVRNRSLRALHEQLVRRSTLLRTLYERREVHRCALNDDHRKFVRLLRTRQVERAAVLIERHYRSVVRGFDMDPRPVSPVDLAAVLGPRLAASAPPRKESRL